MDSRPQTRQVAVLDETDDSWGCSVIRGIADYSQNHGHWNLLLDPQDHDQRSALPDLWNGDGVIARRCVEKQGRLKVANVYTRSWRRDRYDRQRRSWRRDRYDRQRRSWRRDRYDRQRRVR